MRRVIVAFSLGFLLGWSLAAHYARPPVAQFIMKPRDVPVIQIPP